MEPTDLDDGKGTGSVGPMTNALHFKFKSTAIEEKVQTIQAISMNPTVQISDRTALEKEGYLQHNWGISPLRCEFQTNQSNGAPTHTHYLVRKFECRYQNF